MADNPKMPYGDVKYADPGYQADGKKRYPLSDEGKCRAAWSYINQADNAAKYSPEELKAIKGRIRAALKSYGVTVSEDAGRSQPTYYDRSWSLADIEIVSRAKGGDGRTVEALAAVFNTPQEIHDQHGDYIEDISPKAFTRAIDRGWVNNALVLYNHGRTVVDGRVDSLAQVPLGRPMKIEAISRGLLTVTRYNRSALADSVLASIENGDITAQSFRGPIIKSNPSGPVKRVREGQPLPTVTRMELGLTDYGPTPSAYYRDAKILAVRARELLTGISELDEAERAELMKLLTSTRDGDLGADDTATPDVGPGPEDLRELVHSGRSKDLARQRELAQWAELAEMEMAVHG